MSHEQQRISLSGYKGAYGLAAAAVIIAATYFFDPPAGLNESGKNVLGLLFAGLVLWVTEAVPLAVTALFLIIMQPLLGIASPSTAFKSFISPVIFFVIATFGVSAAIMKTPLAGRIARWMLRRSRDKSEYIVLAFMAGAASLSAIVSNVPVTALFMGLALRIVQSNGGQPGSSRLGASLMIAIPFGAMIGGMMTPAGSSINVLALYLMEEYAGSRVSFVQWMVFGVPIAAVLLPITWLILVKTFRPEPLGTGMADLIGSSIPDRWTNTEIKVVVITGLMVALWMAGSWIPALDMTVVAVAGLIAFFLPGVRVLEWDEFSDAVGWDTILMVGGVISIGAAVVETGVGRWVFEITLAGVSGWHIILLTMAVGMVINLLHLVLPIAPAIVAVAIPPLIGLSQIQGVHPSVFVLTTAFLAGCCLLLPLDAVPLITYSKRYYSMLDMFKVGLAASTVWVILAGLWIPLVADRLF